MTAVGCGWAAGSPVPCAATESAGLSTAEGEAAVGDDWTVRAGADVAGAVGFTDGTAAASARGVEFRATCAEALAVGVSSGVCTRVAPGVALVCRATCEAAVAACTSAAARGATLAATAAASVTTFGIAFGACRPVVAAEGELPAFGDGESAAAPERAALATLAGDGAAGPAVAVGSPAARATCGLAVSCLRVANAAGFGEFATCDCCAAATAGSAAAAVGVRFARGVCRAIEGLFVSAGVAEGAFDASRRATFAAVGALAGAVVGSAGAAVVACAVVAGAARRTGLVRGVSGAVSPTTGMGCGVAVGAVVATSVRVVMRVR